LQFEGCRKQLSWHRERERERERAEEEEGEWRSNSTNYCSNKCALFGVPREEEGEVKKQR
jgi:hypothetical protein